VTPLWLTQLETDDQVWEAYQTGRANMMITWASRYIQSQPDRSAASLPPSVEEDAYTYATGWIWTLASSQNEKRELAVRLAESLTEPEFLAAWTQTAGYLPPRADALGMWPEGQLQSFSAQLSLVASLTPSADILSSLSPLMRTAAIQMIKKQGEPLTLAEDAVNHLQNP
jgi:ABC-type glycerol-3-phosphate transport system substrate-binding protein